MVATTDIENAGSAAQESCELKPLNGTTSPSEKKTDKSPVKESKEESSQSTAHKEAMNHFVAGKRHLLVKDLDAAVESLGKASEILSATYGETAYECGDTYFYYGKALLEMARAEAGVFGNALDGVPDGEDSDNSQVEDPEKMTEDEREMVEKQVGEALEENFSAMEEKLKKKTNGVAADSTEGETEEEDEGDEEEKEDGDKEGEKEGEKEKEKECEKEKEGEKEKDAEKKDGEKMDTEDVGGADAEKKEGDDQKEQEAEDEEDPSNLQLAWEMLELAKLAYTKKLDASEKDSDIKKVVEAKLCETLLTLGEVSLEGENYDQAIADISDCLEKRKASLAADNRRIAETLYHLGVALGLHSKFDEAVKSLEEAVSVIKLRISKLEEKKESPDETKVGDAFYTREGEVTELESLIPEIEEKIQDTKESKSQNETNQKEEEGFSGAGKSPAKPISSIAVKRKAEGGDAASPKKPHVAATTNGTTTNGTTNGH